MLKNDGKKLSTSLKFLAKSSLVVLIGLLLSKLFNYIYRIVIARYFGAEEYGLFSLAVILFILFIAASSLGLSDGVLRFISFYRGKKQLGKINFIIKFSLATTLVSGILAGIILYLTSGMIAEKIVHNQGILIYLKVFSFLIPVSVLSNVLLYILRAHEKVKLYSFSMNIFQNFTKVFFLVLFVFIGLKFNPIIASFFLSAVLLLLLAFFLCKYKLPGVFIKRFISKKQKGQISRELFSYSWPFIFVGVISNIFYWTDSLVLGYFKSAFDVGIYNVAIPLASLLGIAPELFMQLFFPMISFEYSRKNFPLIREISKQIGKWIFIINLPLFYLTAFFPEVLINVLFGSEYLPAVNVLRMLSLGALIGTSFTISNSLLSMAGKSKLILLNFSIIAVFNLVLNILLAPKYGMNGTAFSTLLSFFLLTLIVTMQARKYTGILPFRRKMFRILIVSLILLVPALIIKSFFDLSLIAILVSFIVFLIAYAAMIYFSGCLDSNDLEVLGAVKRKLRDYKPLHKSLNISNNSS
ncbi:oligosaccharide flippase family protein [Candidatus Pacearchaeota archaeon]|nr:oligosaccharide flippase family protein [Candidatus Pacearchaeota archaeon]